MCSEPRKPPRPSYMDPHAENKVRAKRSKSHELRLAKRLGGRRLPQSGAGKLSRHAFRASEDPSQVTQNGDLSLHDYWIEHKRTDTATMSLKRDWWEKVREGAGQSGKLPAIILTFETPGELRSKPLDLVVVPLEVFERWRKP